MEDSQFGLLLIYLQEIKAFLSLLGNMPERMHDWNQRCLSLATFGAPDIILLANLSSHDYVLLHNHSWGNGGTIYYLNIRITVGRMTTTEDVPRIL